jgi:hypothetical protein
LPSSANEWLLPLAGTLADYLVPSAADVPGYVTDRTETPATTNPLQPFVKQVAPVAAGLAAGLILGCCSVIADG